MTDLEFFSSPIGLGHVTRDIAIASNFKNISTNFVTGSGAAKILKNLEWKVDDVYKPPQFVVENGSLEELCGITTTGSPTYNRPASPALEKGENQEEIKMETVIKANSDELVMEIEINAPPERVFQPENQRWMKLGNMEHLLFSFP
ncbi:MAG: hypothetical protein P8X83_08070 [Nitrosopumilaceae archaeon]